MIGEEIPFLLLYLHFYKHQMAIAFMKMNLTIPMSVVFIFLSIITTVFAIFFAFSLLYYNFKSIKENLTCMKM